MNNKTLPRYTVHSQQGSFYSNQVRV